jgi:hypothetical protein
MSETATVRDEQFAALATLLGKSGLEFESVIQGSSMGRAIPHGSRIRIRTGGERDYRPGHVVACIHRSGIFAHRIVYRGHGRLREYVITRGDAWLVCDNPIRLPDIVGAVREVNYENQWRPPEGAVGRTLGKRWCAGVALAVVSGCLRLHPGFARAAVAMLRRLNRVASNSRAAPATALVATKASGQPAGRREI